MVYSYVLASSTVFETVEVIDDGQDCIQPDFCPKPHKCISGICTSHFLGTSYVGPLVRQEMAEAWLSTLTFSFPHD